MNPTFRMTDYPQWVRGFMRRGKRYTHPYLRNDFVFDFQKEKQTNE